MPDKKLAWVMVVIGYVIFFVMYYAARHEYKSNIAIKVLVELYYFAITVLLGMTMSLP